MARETRRLILTLFVAAVWANGLAGVLAAELGLTVLAVTQACCATAFFVMLVIEMSA